MVKDFLDVEIQKDLVADLNCKGPDQWHALHFAANEGKVEIVEFLLQRPKIDFSPLSSLRRTPLHLAASRGNSMICELLCDVEKVNIDAQDQDENTALHFASEFGHISTIELLLKHPKKANPNIKNKYGYHPYDIASNSEVRSLFDSIIPRSAL